MNWYYVDQGKQAGPVDDAQLKEMHSSGRIQPDTLVWREGMVNWVPYREAMAEPAQVAGGLRLSKPATESTTEPGEVACAECGRVFPRSDMIRYGTVNVCANCKPVFMQKLQEGAQYGGGRLNYAGFWIRFAAKFVDGLILGILILVPFFIIMARGISSGNEPNAGIQLLLQLGFYVANAGYTIFFLGKYGATPGKMLCRIKVVDGSGAPIGYGRATGRFFAEILSGIICYIGYIMAAFDDEKRTLHDRICNTRVVYK